MFRRRRASTNNAVCALILIAVFAVQSAGQKSSTGSAANTQPDRANAKLTADDSSPSEMRPVIEYYLADRGSLLRSYPVANSPARRERFRKFYSDALERIQKLDFDSMSQAGKVDYILFRSHLEHELRQLDIEAKQLAEIQTLVPFAQTIIDLEEARRRMEPIDSAKLATTLTTLKKQVDDSRRAVEVGMRSDRGNETPADGIEPNRPKKTIAFRAIGALTNLRTNLRNWY